MTHIGTLNERTLHRQLKELVAEPGDESEVELAGFVADILRGEHVIEIQTGSLGALGRKLDALLDSYDVTVVKPISVRSWNHKPDGSSRKSPKRRTILHIFDELVSIPTLIEHPRFSLEIVLIEEDTYRHHDPSLRRRRGGWRVDDRKLRSVVERVPLKSVDDLAALLPAELPDPFTTADLAAEAGVRRELAQRMAYCFRALGVFDEGPRTKAGIEYRLERA